MGVRGWAALLLLAAVFAVHGLQCTAVGAEHTTGHGTAVPAGLLDSGPYTSAVSSGPEVRHGGDHGNVHGISAMVAAGPVAGLLAADLGSAPVGEGGRLWALCLAVLASGLAVLLVLLLPRLLALLSVAWVRLGTHASSGLAPLRPPDLHALCLLRI